MAVELPREIIYDILLRLSVRELCKFRCVSKSLKNLISDPSFVRSHMVRSMKETHLLLKKRGRKLLKNPTGPLDIDSLMRIMRYEDEPFCGITPKFPKYLCRLTSIRPFNEDNFSTRGRGGFMIRQHQNPFDLERSGYSIISCCGGLVLLGNCFQEKTKLCLMNPVSSRINELPEVSEPGSKHGLYDHRSCYCLVYSNSGMEFKVFRFFPAKDGYGCDVMVLNDSPAWARLYEDNLPTIWGKGTLAGGSLYFETAGRQDCSILEFDVGSNKVSLVNDPPGWPDSARDFIEINGELGMSNRKNTRERKVLEIWMLKDKRNSVWVMAYSIKIRVRPRDYLIMPIYFVDEDTWFIEYSGSVFMCDRSGDHFQEVATLYESWLCFYWENLSLL